MFSRSIFKATSYFTLSSVLMCSFAPVKTAFSVGISKERKGSFIKALDVIHEWVISCCSIKGFNKYEMKEINLFHNDIKNLLNLTFERCKEYEKWFEENKEIVDKIKLLEKYYEKAKEQNKKLAMSVFSSDLKNYKKKYEDHKKKRKDIVFALAIQKTFDDFLKGLIGSKGEVVSKEEIGKKNSGLSLNFDLYALRKIRNIWNLCRVCKEILECKNDENGNKKNNFNSISLGKKASILRNLHSSLKRKNIKNVRKYIDEINEEFGELGYYYEDNSLLKRVCDDLYYIENILQWIDDQRQLAYKRFEKISKFEKHFNIDSKLKPETKRSNIMYLYPFFTSFIIKNEINKIFGRDYVEGMFKFLNKFNKNLFKQTINKEYPEYLQKRQLEENVELRNAHIENIKNILKYNVDKFLNKEEQDKLNKALEPSVYEFSTPYIHMPGLMSQ